MPEPYPPHKHPAHPDDAQIAFYAEQILNHAPTEYWRSNHTLWAVRALWALVYLPANIMIAFIRFWRRFISPLYGDVCRFYPTCSAYGLEAITVHGALKGAYLTCVRILRCTPWQRGGVEHVPAGTRDFEPGNEPKILLVNHPQLLQSRAIDEYAAAVADA
ncbi:MAG: membrane protein insertion efficiency factor YidD [Rothia sp. (in: high G+C Gram-positive bacteria)]|uniref:membrane protein insertion efficiency factor YidD n=1 Tax=Rothia sp. (in: high G+C Gram-positive bacteria) TaxID=1885016 RepID=UPI0026DFFE1B|nr:membrane protein insertion efficiency factor YidD [Rothia sp. (in: high G+C Gram-positive bacteria)]MDO5749596.1 membrane protein insertion efficiency factor YidD [Rothia sp. (in: high G+C Gram-positive bacteria)]